MYHRLLADQMPDPLWPELYLVIHKPSGPLLCVCC